MVERRKGEIRKEWKSGGKRGFRTGSKKASTRARDVEKKDEEKKDEIQKVVNVSL